MTQPGRYRAPHRRPLGRRGLSLIEVMVTIAIALALVGVLAYGARSVFDLDQRAAARKIAVLYERLHDEAVMRNLSFRVAFYLDQGRYVVEAGEPGALISSSPDERAQFEEEMRSKLDRMDERERLAFLRSRQQPFEALGAEGKMEFKLPAGTQFGGVYTPQYGQLMRPGDAPDGKRTRGADEEAAPILSYVMNNGYVEHTLVQLVNPAGTDGFTVEVEPLSGVVKLHGELVDVYDIRKDVPSNGPSLPN